MNTWLRAALAFALTTSAAQAAAMSFAISFPPKMSAVPVDGHITLIIAKGKTAEPRMLLGEGSRTPIT